MDDIILTHLDSITAMDEGDQVYYSLPMRKHDIDMDTEGILKRYKIEADDQLNTDVANDLDKFRIQRLEESRQRIYILPMAKASLQARDDALFSLMENTLEFLAGDRQVFLVLGDSGAGKSTFNLELEHTLWKDYKEGGPIPLYINLPYIDNPEQDLIEKQLLYHNFPDDQIQEMKHHRQFILICDGYDESQLAINLYNTNRLNQESQWRAKMIVSCRSQFLGSIYLDRFAPQLGAHDQRPILDLFQEAVIAPFSTQQVEEYVTRYVPLEPRPWLAEDYMRMLTTIPNLMDLVKNPFLLTLALETLPAITEGRQDLSTIRIARVQLYDAFVVHWLDINKRRLESCALSGHDRATFDQLLEAGFVSMAFEYSVRLASAIFDNQDGGPVIQYVSPSDKMSWKTAFLGDDPVMRLLLESSPLTRSGAYFQFIHRSMLEYFFSCVIYNRPNVDALFAPQAATPSPTAPLLDPDNPLYRRNLIIEPSIILFLCDRVNLNPAFEQQLRSTIDQSKTDTGATVAATNAISILVRAGLSFHGADLRGVKIPGADLTDGQFDSAQFQGADLSGANLSRCWLRKVDLDDACMEGVRFEELPYLAAGGRVNACAFSPDGKLLALAAGLFDGIIEVYDTFTWTRLHQIRLGFMSVDSIAFSPDNRHMVSGNSKGRVRSWDSISGKEVVAMEGHLALVTCVAFSPCGKRIASASMEGTVRLWDAQTGGSLSILQGHTKAVMCVVYSPDGQRLVSGSRDGTIRCWNAETGEPGAILNPSLGEANSLAYSPDGLWVASGHERGDIQLWSTVSNEPISVLRSHTTHVTGLAFSPELRWIASSSKDGTVRLWDTSTGVLVSTFTAHKKTVCDVAFSPDGLQLASAGVDSKVRLWELSSAWSSVELHNQTGSVWNVTYSINGEIISIKDHTVQHWDPALGERGSASSFRFPNILSNGTAVISPSGKQIATSTIDADIRLWDLHNGTAGPVLEGHLTRVEGMVYSPCSCWIVSADYAKNVRLWNLNDLEQESILTDESIDSDDAIQCVAMSPTGQQFAVGYMSGSVRLFDPRSRKLLLTKELSRTSALMALAFSPNGTELAGGTYGNTINVWNIQSEKSGVKLSGHDAAVVCVAYSSCSGWITSGSEDHTVRLWLRQSSDKAIEGSWSCVSMVNGFLNTVHNVAWSPIVPMEFVTGCEDGSVRLWRVSRESESERVVVSLIWGSSLGVLCITDTNLSNVTGLSPTQLKLLVQRGAIVDSLHV